ncbi:uncharacterized protein LOC144647794 isoform X1 [Oculina patagonica]
MCRRRAIERVLKFTVLVLILAGIVVYFTNAGKRLLQEETVSDNSAEIDREADFQRLQAAYDDVDTVLLFIGYPRSRHTLVSALLDAHPNIMLANEMNLIGAYRSHPEWSKTKMFDAITSRSYKLATKGRRSQTTEGNASNYSHLGYKVPNQWQGTFDQTLKVLGDKVGWFTASHLARETGRSYLKELEDNYNVKAKFIHVIRNPFDNIATMAMRLIKDLRTEQHSEKQNISKQLDNSIRRYFKIATNCQATKEAYGDRVLDIPGEDFVRDPSKYLRQICDFLEITCSEDYLRDCSSIVDPVPSVTRNMLVWTPEQIEQVYDYMRPLEFLQSYTFEN